MNASFEGQQLLASDQTVAAGVSAPTGTPAAVPTDWTFGGLWPFEPRWFETSDGRLHYVDEGPRDGRPVVLVHGNPTWGFLYRNFIGPLTEAGHRAIVPDHLGFGRSDKPSDPELYRIPRHVARLDALLESLDLHDAVVVVQDWGGPIGLSWAVAHPERISGLFILDTFAGPRQNLPVPLQLFRTPGVGEVLVKGFDMFVRGFLFRDGVVHRERLTDEVRRAYLAPHPTWSSRTGELVFPREIPNPASATGPVAELLTRLERGLEQHFRSKPARIMWAMRDPAFTPTVLEEWRKTLPDAPVTQLDDASHYLQEDAHERIVPQLLSFLAETKLVGCWPAGHPAPPTRPRRQRDAPAMSLAPRLSPAACGLDRAGDGNKPALSAWEVSAVAWRWPVSFMTCVLRRPSATAAVRNSGRAAARRPSRPIAWQPLG